MPRLRLRFPSLHVLLLVAFALALLLVFQLPLRYGIDVGVEEGYGSDIPHLQGFRPHRRGFHGAETNKSTGHTFRWTLDKATIMLPGIGQRALLVRLDVLPIDEYAFTHGPREIAVWAADEHLATLPVSRDGAHYHVIVPARLVTAGRLDLVLRTSTFPAPSPEDPRELGIPLAYVTLTSLPTGRLVAPDWFAFGGWLLAMLLLLAVCRTALGSMPHPAHRHADAPPVRWSSAIAAIAGVLVVIAAALDPPRWAFGTRSVLVALLACLLLALLLRWALPWLAARLAIPLSARTLGWLVLIVVVAFGLRYGGRLYPRSMHGDIGFHRNRFNETTWGDIYIISRNRGVNFPYPPGPYLVVAPFGLLHPDPPNLLELTSTLAEGLSVALVYALVAQSLTAAGGSVRRAQRRGLLAAAVYGFSAAGFMTNWWSFDTHIYAQASTLLLIAFLHFVAVRLSSATAINGQQRAPPAPVPAPLLFLLFSLVFLGHFGFLINTVLMVGLLIVLVWLAAWRGSAWARRVRWPLLLTYTGAGLFALIFFYSAYIPMFLEQARVTAESGLTGLAERAPVPRWYLWQVLWEAGLITHFGFFPLLLAPLSLGMAACAGRLHHITRTMMGCSFLVSLAFAVLPFITLSTQSTRWLMFSAWAVAIGAALVVGALWRYGRSGRLVVLAMAGFVLWNTAVVWLEPLAWRIRPPEPF